MSLLGDDSHHLRRALDHPVRMRLFEVAWTSDRRRAISVKDACQHLGAEFPELSSAQAAYHLFRLRDVEALPTSSGGSPWV